MINYKAQILKRAQAMIGFCVAYTSGLIFVVVIAMLSERVEKILTAKVATGLFMAASTCIVGHFYKTEYEIVQVSETPTMNWDTIIISPRKVHSIKEIRPLPHRPDPTKVVSEATSVAKGIDFSPICGGGDYGDGNRLDIANSIQAQKIQRKSC